MMGHPRALQYNFETYWDWLLFFVFLLTNRMMMLRLFWTCFDFRRLGLQLLLLNVQQLWLGLLFLFQWLLLSLGSRGLQMLTIVFGVRIMRIRLMEAGITGWPMHHMRLTVHHITHRIMSITRWTSMRCINYSKKKKTEQISLKLIN